MKYNAKILRIENGWLLDDNVTGVTYYSNLELLLEAIRGVVKNT